MNLVLCERYSTKMTAGACEKFRANTPERCKGCDGPVADAQIEGPVVLTTPVHAKPKSAPMVVNYAKRNAQVRAKKEEAKAVEKPEKKQTKKIAACGKCAEEKPIMSRGLCGKCWHQENYAGTLDENFPSAYQKVSTPKPKQEKKGKPCKSCGEKDQVSSRGLCTDCYTAEYRQGILDHNYPSPHGAVDPEIRATKAAVEQQAQLIESQGNELSDRTDRMKQEDSLIKINSDGLPAEFNTFVSDLFKQMGTDLYPGGCEIHRVTISFRYDDQLLLDHLNTQAKKNRRSIDQEILFRLENGMVP